MGSAGQRYLDALRSIDPGLVAPLDRAIHHAANVREDLAQGKDRATVVKNAALRFDGGDASVDQAKAEKIVAAIESSGVCTGVAHV